MSTEPRKEPSPHEESAYRIALCRGRDPRASPASPPAAARRSRERQLGTTTTTSSSSSPVNIVGTYNNGTPAKGGTYTWGCEQSFGFTNNFDPTGEYLGTA